jgi:LAO/AO transport system kinase
MKRLKNESALKIQAGVNQQEAINPHLTAKPFFSNRYSAEYYVNGISNGNRAILSQAITLVESKLSSDQEIAQKIIEACLPFSGNSLRIGITGVPGVGKSTFIETFGFALVQNHRKKLAVLAIDPSSARSKGSILGDKTRMEKLANHPMAFIRPSPSSGSLGGVAQKTRESIILCEAAGYDLIFVETVGVGQSETLVHSMVDFFLLLMLAGAGDELQGIKRGIMEMADAIIINKADGDNIQKAHIAQLEYSNALHLFPPSPSQWTPKTAVCSSKDETGIDAIWNMIMDYQQFTLKNGYFEQKRNEQQFLIYKASIESKWQQLFYSDKSIQNMSNELSKLIENKKMSPYNAAERLMNYFIEKRNKS